MAVNLCDMKLRHGGDVNNKHCKKAMDLDPTETLRIYGYHHENEASKVYDLAKAKEFYNKLFSLAPDQAITSLIVLLQSGSEEEKKEFIGKLEGVQSPSSYGYLSTVYMLGENVEKDINKGRMYAAKALLGGDLSAAHDFSLFFRSEKNPEKSETKELAWIEAYLARSSSSPEAIIKDADYLRSKYSAIQLAEVDGYKNQILNEYYKNADKARVCIAQLSNAPSLKGKKTEIKIGGQIRFEPHDINKQITKVFFLDYDGIADITLKANGRDVYSTKVQFYKDLPFDYCISYSSELGIFEKTRSSSLNKCSCEGERI